MRIAIVSDIHGNRTAFDAVLADLRVTAPDLILHGGDLADSGSDPAGVIDQIRGLGWPGVLGNADEIHTRPESLDEFEAGSKAPVSLWKAVRETAEWARARLGMERIAWLATLPRAMSLPPVVLVHAGPDDIWRAPGAEASDDGLERTYAPLGGEIAVYGHTHYPFVRPLARMTVANSGSAGLPYDGDPRASYLLIDGTAATIRRVEYDIGREVAELAAHGHPHREWLESMLRAAAPRFP